MSEYVEELRVVHNGGAMLGFKVSHEDALDGNFFFTEAEESIDPPLSGHRRDILEGRGRPKDPEWPILPTHAGHVQGSITRTWSMDRRAEFRGWGRWSCASQLPACFGGDPVFVDSLHQMPAFEIVTHSFPRYTY